ncbi:nucleic-acid-binding protein from transposon X-element [Trichonephila clavata]|uniref:Nucleic-acid-binding protein from transposon X-element n=1 Tax=Trichonephila clavata TaxID=2740835 RepID=A0A8X6IPE9_TRICU|nr:nucleic-acid-binding protein from transposon X-element [Trichonephila clavata]
MELEEVSPSTQTQVSAFSVVSLSAFNVQEASVKVDSLKTSDECSDFCAALEDLLFQFNANNSAQLGLEELRAINSISWICIRCSRKTVTLLASEFKEQILALGAKKEESKPVESTPIESKNEVVSQVESLPPSSGKTAAKRSSTSPKRKGNKKKVKTNAEKHEDLVKTSNPFQALTPVESSDIEVDDSEDVVDEPTSVIADHTPTAPVAQLAPTSVNTNQPETSSSDVDQAEIKPKRVPPIVIDEQYNTPGLLADLSGHIGTKLMGKIVGGKLKVFPETIDAHRKIQNFVSVKKLKSHTYELAEEKQLKTVIRGLPSDYDTNEIIQALGELNIVPEHVTVMRNRSKNVNMPLFLVVSKKTPENQKIFKVTSIGYYKIKVESLNKNSMPAQCYRCQLFYHHSRFCNREPKCLKCGLNHLTRDCKKNTDSPAKCANCDGSHPANYSGCPKNPKNLKPSKPPAKNVWDERAKVLEKQKINKNENANKNEKKNTSVSPASSDTKILLDQMSAMMSQFGTMFQMVMSTLGNKI